MVCMSIVTVMEVEVEDEVGRKRMPQGEDVVRAQ